MSSFDEREKGYEKKFAHDAELRFKATARRNKLLGLWAAELMGKTGDDADDVDGADDAPQGPAPFIGLFENSVRQSDRDSLQLEDAAPYDPSVVTVAREPSGRTRR